jgi:hypothetical protein
VNRFASKALAVVLPLVWCGACASVSSEFVATAPADAAAAVSRPAARAGTVLAADLLAFVVVEREHRGGYRRELFAYPHSTGNGCDTRDRVLELESSTPVRFTASGCNIARGTWTSVYDGVAYTSPSGLEIDHVVALKEAWDSGAWRWSRAALEAFANDTTDGRTLQAVSSKSNRSKGDKDPSNWLPPSSNDVCRYAGDWVAIKVRWHLSMDPSEFGRLRNLFRGSCSGWTVQPFARTPVPVP